MFVRRKIKRKDWIKGFMPRSNLFNVDGDDFLCPWEIFFLDVRLV